MMSLTNPPLGRLQGVIAAVPTPLDASGQPRIDALLRFCDRLLTTGCNGINLLGTTGEATSLTSDARLRIMEAVAMAGRAGNMMVGTGTPSLESTVLLTRAASDFGFRGALVLPPFFYPDPTDDAIFEYFSEVVRQANPDCGIYLYNIPQNTGIKLSPPLVKRLHEAHPKSIVGLKDSSGDLAYATQVAAELEDFDVFPSHEATLAQSRANGFKGCISATVNVAPWFAHDVYKTQAGAGHAFDAMNHVRGKLASLGLIPAVKAAVSLIQADGEWLRPLLPLRALGEPALAEVRALLAKHSIAVGASK
jgi:4-hydroxy-tetrahydrodipicolinate synthase